MREVNDFLLEVNLLLIQSMPDDTLLIFRHAIETDADPRFLPWWLAVNHVYEYNGQTPILDANTKTALLGYIRARQTIKALHTSIARKITSRM